VPFEEIEAAFNGGVPRGALKVQLEL